MSASAWLPHPASTKRVLLETVETVLRLYHEQYFDFSVQHFHEKLKEEHNIKLSYTWVKKALQGAGLVKLRRKRVKHRKRRHQRDLLRAVGGGGIDAHGAGRVARSDRAARSLLCAL